MNGGRPSLSELSRGEYGARVGLGRIVDLLADFQIPASFFVPAVSALLHPSIVETIQSNQDHEIGVHGWIHEHPSWLEPDEELSLMERSLSVLTEQSGTRPVGYRAPAYDLHAHTFEILEQLDFLYDSSLMADDRPYEILSKGEPTGLVELPGRMAAGRCDDPRPARRELHVAARVAADSHRRVRRGLRREDRVLGHDAPPNHRPPLSHRRVARAHRPHTVKGERVVRDAPARGGASQEAAC